MLRGRQAGSSLLRLHRPCHPPPVSLRGTGGGTWRPGRRPASGLPESGRRCTKLQTAIRARSAVRRGTRFHVRHPPGFATALVEAAEGMNS